jgi:hypothetical protein
MSFKGHVGALCGALRHAVNSVQADFKLQNAAPQESVCAAHDSVACAAVGVL